MIDLNSLVGQTLTEELSAQILADHPGVRIKKPGYMYTQEYRSGRINVVVDAQGVIIRVARG